MPIHITAPAEDGDGAYRCMRMALKRAGIEPSDIQYVNAHGTSTMGDEIELAAVERLFGNAAGKLAMSSTKSAIGHLLGAAGAVEAIFSVLAIRDNIAPPTLNLDNPSVETAIDLVPHKAQKRADRHGALQLVRLRRHQRLARACAVRRRDSGSRLSPRLRRCQACHGQIVLSPHLPSSLRRIRQLVLERCARSDARRGSAACLQERT